MLPSFDPSPPLSGQISFASSGHLIAAFGPVIMSALLDCPVSPLPGGNWLKRSFVHPT
ncbi:hypothetical protein SJA_C1-26320 [Sphingobium indicum UT26S]|uniref:Uncharacterized protein n=1 Tax=Sphingobium indicum (strain DSM 16413 / CCM 7287 / MTCC 6362 / UT26 / NBRC 101211 / UT26S) TaxID=452662 RepID=D4Z4D4_SPHIU|nr:hypothetical protein SJA_C1-26320 [Sphingobium indicum UT26S]